VPNDEEPILERVASWIGVESSRFQQIRQTAQARGFTIVFDDAIRTRYS
jgi:hypothetical protein